MSTGPLISEQVEDKLDKGQKADAIFNESIYLPKVVKIRFVSFYTKEHNKYED